MCHLCYSANSQLNSKCDAMWTLWLLLGWRRLSTLWIVCHLFSRKHNPSSEKRPSKIKLDWQQPSIQFISFVQTVVVSLQVQKAINLLLRNVEKTLEKKSFKGHKADIQLLRDVIRSYYINDLFKIDLMSEVAIHMRYVRGKYWIYISDWMGINRDDRYLVPLEELPLRRSLRIASRTVLSKLADRRRTRMKKN